MNYRLKNTNGKVTFLLRTGKDLVKNQMAIASAQHIIDHGKLLKSDVSGYPINIDNNGTLRARFPRGQHPAKRRMKNEDILL